MHESGVGTWEFTVRLRGNGTTAEDAWTDAIEGFMLDPGDPETEEEIDLGKESI